MTVAVDKMSQPLLLFLLDVLFEHTDLNIQ